MSDDGEFKLIGNDYSIEQIKKWYDEEENFHNQFSAGRNAADDYWIIYEVFNRRYAIDKYVKFSNETKILSFGCAEGSDTARLYKEHNFRLFGVESSEKLIEAFKENFPDGEIVKATIEGKISYADDFFDYVFCFGVLHHIPNVSYVLEEFWRVLKSGGIAIIREPICWMYSGGDRPADLSPNERGIPVEYFKNEFSRLDFKLLSIQMSYYKPLMSVLRKTKMLWRLPNLMYSLDRVAGKLPSSKKYYPDSFADKFAPSSAYYVIQKK